MVGNHWGIEDASCPDRANPPVPAWHAKATYRFNVGLADDMVGYLLPSWGFSTQPGVYATTCFNDQDDKDQRGHQHKLETESVGPAAGNAVAEHLSRLLDAGPGPGAGFGTGRFVRADGSLSRSPVGAVGLWLAGSDHGGTGMLLGAKGVRAFGSRPVDGHGQFIDYDAVTQSSPDMLTHGMNVDGWPVYVDVYPDVSAPSLGAAH